MLLRAILCGGVWNGFLVGCVVREMVMGIFSGSAPFPPLSLQHVRDLSEFTFLMSLDRSNWPRCFLWHGWLPGLGGAGDDNPWAASFGDLAFGALERCLGPSCGSSSRFFWTTVRDKGFVEAMVADSDISTIGQLGPGRSFEQ